MGARHERLADTPTARRFATADRARVGFGDIIPAVVDRRTMVGECDS